MRESRLYFAELTESTSIKGDVGDNGDAHIIDDRGDNVADETAVGKSAL